MYFGIFHGSTPYEGTKEFLEKAHEAWPSKPILNTEYGIWSSEDDSLAGEQVKITEETLKALLEKASVLPDGTLNPEGYLAGVDYWIMYNWYVNHNNWIQTMGIYHMDRETLKPIGEMIKTYYDKWAK
jgi:beta-glucuronidase